MDDKDVSKAIFGCVFIIVALLVALVYVIFGGAS
jgi:hypothetical protein